jgi:hypothetical protein
MPVLPVCCQPQFVCDAHVMQLVALQAAWSSAGALESLQKSSALTQLDSRTAGVALGPMSSPLRHFFFARSQPQPFCAVHATQLLPHGAHGSFELRSEEDVSPSAPSAPSTLDALHAVTRTIAANEDIVDTVLIFIDAS